jgi:tetratricopeptide (TPR) repeat protein
LRAGCLGLGIALLLLGPPGSGATAAEGGAIADALRVARNRYVEGSFDQSAEAARAALDDDPADLEALDALSCALAATGEEAAAEKELRAWAAKAPGKPGPAIAIADLVAARDPAAAEALYREALAAGAPAPGVAMRARIGLAAALLERGAPAEAEKELRAVFDLYRAADDDALTAADFRAMARAALLAERVPALRKEHARPFAKDARDFYQTAWKKAPGDPDLLVAWARIYAEKWDLPEARRLAKEAVKLAPRHAAGHALLAEIALQDLYGGTKKYEEAAEELETALAINPRYAPAWTLRAELLVTDGLYDEALDALAKALDARPLDLRAAGDRAGILLLTDRAAAAEAVEKAVLARAGPSPRPSGGQGAGSGDGGAGPQAAEFHARLAALLDAKFRYGLAYRYAKQAVEDDPEYWPAYAQLGLAAMRTGDEAEAKRYLEKAADADPFDLFTLNLLTLLRYLGREFVTEKTPHFVLRMHRDEAPLLGPEIEPLMERCWEELSRRYGVTVDTPILLEVFPNLQDFSVRAVAHRFIPASGVTFARVVALASPHALPPGTHGWGRVLWHELAHVATLERSGYRVPRWLTEGISVFEEQKGDPAWTREWDEMLVDALERGRLLPIRELDQGFSKPRFPNQVMLSYYQGGLICQFIEKTWGFPAILALLDGYRAGKPLPENLAQALGGISPEEFDARFFAFARACFAGVTYRAPCETEDALAALRRATKARPGDVDALARYALAAADMRRWADAEGAALQLEKLAPGNGDAKLALAAVVEHRGDPDRAAALAAEAVAAGTRDPLGAQLLRLRYFAEKDPKTGARRDLRRAIAAAEAAHALFPRLAGPVGTLVELYAEASEDEKRAALLETLAELEPNDAATRLELAKRAWERRDLPPMKRWTHEVRFIDPFSPTLHALLAGIAVLEGRVDDAERRLAVTKALAEKPGSRRALETLAPLLREVQLALEKARGGGTAPPGEAPPDAPGAPGGPDRGLR